MSEKRANCPPRTREQWAAIVPHEVAKCSPAHIAYLIEDAQAALEAQAARIEVLEGALRRIEHEAIIRKSENAAQTVDDLRALARAALGGNHD